MVQSGDYSSNSPAASPDQAGDLTSLYVGYALILFAVPTFGVAAAIGLLRMWRKEPPADPLARSHFIFQQRTLMAAVAAIVGGVVLILINVGVFVLFIMAVWTILRGALGLKDLLEGRPIRHPLRLFY